MELPDAVLVLDVVLAFQYAVWHSAVLAVVLAFHLRCGKSESWSWQCGHI